MKLLRALLWLLPVAVATPVDPDTSKADYLSQREAMIADEVSMRIGGNIVLTPAEKVVNTVIMREKEREMDQSRKNRTVYWNSASFYLSKPHIANSQIFNLIKRMPKGAALHIHDLAVGQGTWVVKNATYRENVYMCEFAGGFIKLAVWPNDTFNHDCAWESVESKRAESGDAEAFDQMLINNITMLASDPLTTYDTLTKVWNRFNIYFQQVIGLLYYVPVMRDYFKQALQDFHDDNVQYIEMRVLPSGLFELGGKPLGADYAVGMYKEVMEEFVREHPDFSGAKLIYTSIRSADPPTIMEDVKEAMRLRKKYPTFLLGYDLVGQEDPNHSLKYYLDALLYPSQQGEDLPYFFHAAETNWQGTDVDYNLVDALLLNTSRIGHGYGLIKHPKLAKMVKERDIALEINPISNQILGLVKDLRNHALIPMLADDFPVVISSDDPGTWSATPLSHDFYVAFMTMSGRDAGLGLLKELARNSIKYSMMDETEKSRALKIWEAKWDAYIKEMAEILRLFDVFTHPCVPVPSIDEMDD